MITTYKLEGNQFVLVKEDNEQVHNFDGSDYDSHIDKERLTGQLKRIYNLMRDGEYRTLNEISKETNDPESSVSAQLRNLRKERFGGYQIDKRRRGESSGLWEYRLSEVLN